MRSSAAQRGVARGASREIEAYALVFGSGHENSIKQFADYI